MKAISLWQPWAPLIACSAKPYETAGSLIGQTIAIHVATKINKGAAQFAEELIMASTRMAGSTSPTDSKQRCPAPPTS
jgi:hypothetical protein